MKATHIGPRIVFVVCCVATLSALALSVPQAAAQERAAFDAFFDTVTRAEGELWRVIHRQADSQMKRQVPAEVTK